MNEPLEPHWVINTRLPRQHIVDTAQVDSHESAECGADPGIDPWGLAGNAIDRFRLLPKCARCMKALKRLGLPDPGEETS